MSEWKRGAYFEEREVVVTRLRNAGVNTDTVFDMVRGPTPPEAVPVLIEMLPGVKHPRLREVMVRLLATPEARGRVERALLKEFFSDRGDEIVQAAIGGTIAYLADESLYDDILKIVKDRSHGRARRMFVQALGKMEREPGVVDVLIELLKDEEVAFDAMVALEKLRAEKALPYIRPFLEHPRVVLRNRARKAIAAIEGDPGDTGPGTCPGGSPGPQEPGC